MKKMILFGTGDIGLGALNYFGKENVLCGCSNESDDKREQRKKIWGGVDIISPEKLSEMINDEVEVVVSVIEPDYVRQISEQLESMNIPFVTISELSTRIADVELKEYERLNTRENFAYNKEYRYVLPVDRFRQASRIDEYFWQDLWAAKHIYHNTPQDNTHYDIASRIDGFVSHLLAMDIIVRNIDVRPLDIVIPGLKFCRGNATNLDTIEDDSIYSLSALCSIEHFGLGRYGDSVDPEGCFKCFESIQRKMHTGGLIYISVPVGKERLRFNDCRVFYAQTVIDCFDKMELIEFASCGKNDIKVEDNIHKYDKDVNFDLRFGLFMMRKK